MENDKILFVVDSLSGGGAERVISIISKTIAENYNKEVSIFLPFGNEICYEIPTSVGIYDLNGNELSHELTNVVKNNESNGNREVKIAKRKSFVNKIIDSYIEKKDNIRRARLLADFVNKNAYNVVISFLNSSNIIACLSKKYIRAKLVISERNNPDNTNTNSSHYFLKNFNKADKIVFQTEYAKESFPKYIQAKGIVIPNPVNGSLPNRFMGERKKEIVCFGRFDSQKNLPLLINAFYDVYKKHNDYSLILYGKGQEKDNIIALIKQLNIEKVVSINDFCSDIHNRIIDAKMYVSSSNYEGISNSMLEALAIGLPCVCTDCPAYGGRLCIKNNENGILVPVNDKKSLVNAINKIIEDDEFAEKLSVNASKVRENFSANKISQMWIETII